ncbi:peptidase M14 [Oleiharenicola lentus]|uniref:peptidase M14 n=1 Tax=Oleiharenicola lentus TaxID=2508720 RepID=UPI003F676D3E
MVLSAQFPDTRDLRLLYAPLEALLGRSQELVRGLLGKFSLGGRDYEIDGFRFVGPYAGHDPIHLGFFAGVHGDEPAGCAALVEFLLALVREPKRAAGYELWVYPVVNPTGIEDGTRENRAKKDLNREFWRGSSQPEVKLIEAELRDRRFQGLITLHSDDTCDGIYGYTHGRTLDEALLRPALLAAERLLPRDCRETIDGFSAKEGMISDCFKGVLSAPPEQKPQPFDLIFETPAKAPFKDQVAATVAALDSVIANYRGFIAHAQNL